MSAYPVPPLVERKKPPLSATLPYVPHPHICQSCGATEEDSSTTYEQLLKSRGAIVPFQRWKECDEWDKPTATVVILCPKCSKKLIDPHPRLYIPLSLFEPFPGVMELCVGCRLRDRVACMSPLAKHNGGPGMKIDFPEPVVAHLNRGAGGRSGFEKLYTKEPTACAGRELVEGV